MGEKVQDSSVVKMPSLNPSKNRAQHRARSICTSLAPSPTSSILLVSFVISLFMNGGLKPLTKRGFFCSDTSIRYPIRSDTVSFGVLLAVALVMPSIVILLLDRKLSRLLRVGSNKPGLRIRKDSDHIQNDTEEVEELMQPGRAKRRMVINDDGDSDLEELEREKMVCDNSGNQSDIESLSASLRFSSETTEVVNEDPDVKFVETPKHRSETSARKFSDLQLFLFGFVVTSFLTGLGKTTTGRLRPHFMERCKPNIDCALLINSHRYIKDFKCTDETMRPRDYSYITTSFPSGHASIMFFSMLYLIFYLNLIIPTITNHKTARRSLLIGFYPFISYGAYVLMVGLAIYISLTRVSDYHHHPTDVLS